MNHGNIEILFSIIGYFSSNHPFTKEKLEEFFHTSFFTSPNETEKLLPMNNDILVNFIEYIELRGNENKQLLEIKFLSEKFIVDYKNLDKIMEEKNYKNFAYIPNAFYATLLDKENNIGTVRLGYQFCEDSPETIEITDLVFDTYEAFNLE